MRATSVGSDGSGQTIQVSEQHSEMRGRHDYSLSSNTSQQPRDPAWKVGDWQLYGTEDSSLTQFFTENADKIPAIHTIDLFERSGTLHTDRARIESFDQLQQYLDPGPSEDVCLRILGIESLSTDCLKVLGTTFEIHFGFWAWVLSEEAADGYWWHNHNNGTVLCFDLPTIEEYTGLERNFVGYCHGGQFKQLSTIHQFNYDQLVDDVIYANRRVTGFMTNKGSVPVFLYICEKFNAPEPPFDPDQGLPGMIPSPSVSWLLGEFDQCSELVGEIAADPFTIIAILEKRLLCNWSTFITRMGRRIETADNIELSEDNAGNATVFNVARLLQQDIQRTISRFQSHLEAHEGYLMHVHGRAAKGLWCPSSSMIRWHDLSKKMKMLTFRLSTTRKRADNILSIMLSKISIRHSQLAFDQAERSREMAHLTLLDTQASLEQGKSMQRLTFLASLFLPTSTIATIFGMNVNELTDGTPPIWLFFVLAAFATVLCFTLMVRPNLSTSAQWPYLVKRKPDYVANLRKKMGDSIV